MIVQVEKRPGSPRPVVCIILDNSEPEPDVEEIKVMLMTAGMAMGYHLDPKTMIRLDTHWDDESGGHGRRHV